MSCPFPKVPDLQGGSRPWPWQFSEFLGSMALLIFRSVYLVRRPSMPAGFEPFKSLLGMDVAYAQYVMASKFQWKPFCFATQRDAQNDWTAT